MEISRLAQSNSLQALLQCDLVDPHPSLALFLLAFASLRVLIVRYVLVELLYLFVSLIARYTQVLLTLIIILYGRVYSLKANETVRVQVALKERRLMGFYQDL